MCRLKSIYEFHIIDFMRRWKILSEGLTVFCKRHFQLTLHLPHSLSSQFFIFLVLPLPRFSLPHSSSSSFFLFLSLHRPHSSSSSFLIFLILNLPKFFLVLNLNLPQSFFLFLILPLPHFPIPHSSSSVAACFQSSLHVGQQPQVTRQPRMGTLSICVRL